MFAPAPSTAHEFWIDPADFTIAPGAMLEAALRVGERFEGASRPYIPAEFERFEIVTGGGGAPRPVEGRIGDRPALRLDVAEPGLVTLIHVTRDYDLTWESWAAFRDFLRHKDAAWALAAHAERGLAREGVTETYSRYGKSLVAVGDGAGQDRAHGLLTEIVALENPYTGETADGLDIRLLYRGAPRAQAQVEIFARSPEGGVEIATVRTDGSGMATIPVEPGQSYLLDAVVLRAPEGGVAQWESLWASLTFAVPTE